MKESPRQDSTKESKTRSPKEKSFSKRRLSAKVLIFAGCLLLVAALVGGFFILPKVQRSSGGSSDDAQRRAEIAPYIGPVSPTEPSVIALTPDIATDNGGVATSMNISVGVAPPDGARAVQLSQDPTFADAEWQGIKNSIDFRVAGVGYQQVFARFLTEGSEPGPTSVAGIVVDLTYEQAVSSASGDHQPSWIRPLTSSELVVRIEAGRLVYGGLEPYNLDEPLPGDRLITIGDRTAVDRDGQTFGFQVSQRRDVVKRPDRFIGRTLDIEQVVDGPWHITGVDDPSQSITPESVRYIARPTGGGIDQDQGRIYPVVYDLVLLLPTTLNENEAYLVEGPNLAPTDFIFEPKATTSPAIRVNQVGYQPNDKVKVAYLSGWFDGLGATVDELVDSAAGGVPFRVISVDSELVVYRGTGQRRDTNDELGKGDLTGASVVELDFGGLTDSGRYRICVDQVGCSYEFAISDYLWDGLVAQVSRAMYHQRSGIELGPPYTSVMRPRPYHPDDDFQVLTSDYTLIEAQTETYNTDFAKLADKSTGDTISEAWGGHFDAGDWDRRIQHLWYARAAAEAVLQSPETFETLEMNIPESGDNVPDLLDEALWTVDVFRRMQRVDGAIRGGIEASEHPPPYSSSWSDDLAVYAYEPDAYSSYVYAGVAAEVAHALEPYDGARSQDLLESAELAMAWAESQSDVEQPLTEDGLNPTASQRHVASAGLLLATGEQRWHDLFIETADYLTASGTGGGPFMSCHAHYECDAGWMYLLASESDTDREVRAALERKFVESADGLLAVADGTAYGWSPENPFVPLIWGLGAGGAPHTSGMMKAYLLTGEDRFRNAAIRAASVPLGANPMNRSMITGLGHEPPQHPLIVDVANGGLPLWAGTPVYGYHTLEDGPDDWVSNDILVPAGASPSPSEVPYLWQWYDVVPIAPFNEFTVHQSHADALTTFATLAATS